MNYLACAAAILLRALSAAFRQARVPLRAFDGDLCHADVRLKSAAFLGVPFRPAFAFPVAFAVPLVPAPIVMIVIMRGMRLCGYRRGGSDGRRGCITAPAAAKVLADDRSGSATDACADYGARLAADRFPDGSTGSAPHGTADDRAGFALS